MSDSVNFSGVNDNDKEPDMPLDVYSPPIVVRAEREIASTLQDPADGNPRMGDSDLDASKSVDELCHSSSWYRFGASLATPGSNTGLQDRARPCYVACLEDVSREHEFHNVLGKEDMDSEVYYMVDWVPNLVRGHVLRKSQAQPLISRFEARCQD
jgi:hypothetical protein